MSYKQFTIDELTADKVTAVYRDVSSEGKGPIINKAFELDKISKEEPMCAELVKGDIIGIYYEKKGNAPSHTEKQWLDGRLEKLTEEEEKFCEDMITSICVDNKYDHLNAPPSVDEQVESFIKEFFDEEDEDKPLEKRDFLEEFFEELDEENK